LFEKDSPQRLRERREIYQFSFVAETPTNESYHASGSLLTNKTCPKGLGLFLFALLREKE
jgi:hypothetical protein